MKTIYILCLTGVFCGVIENLTRGEETLEQSQIFLDQLKKIAEKMEYFPLQKIIFEESFFCMDDYFIASNSKQCRIFYDFMEFAQNAKNNDIQECIDYLNEASPKEKCLIFVVLHCSLKYEYLPLIAKYVNDQEIAFPSLTYCLVTSRFNMTKEQIHEITQERILAEKSGNDLINKERSIKYKIDKGEKISRLEKTLCSAKSPSRSSAGPIQYFSEKQIDAFYLPQNYELVMQGKRVGVYARAVLFKWGCRLTDEKTGISGLDNLSYKWFVPSKEYWDEYYKSRVYCKYYYNNMYMIQVECARPEDYDYATIEFLKKLEKFPKNIRLYIQQCNGLFSEYHLIENVFKIKDYYVFFTPENYSYPCDIKQPELAERYLKNHQKVYNKKQFESLPIPTNEEIYEALFKNEKCELYSKVVYALKS
jgi:hypothetical protein